MLALYYSFGNSYINKKTSDYQNFYGQCVVDNVYKINRQGNRRMENYQKGEKAAKGYWN